MFATLMPITIDFKTSALLTSQNKPYQASSKTIMTSPSALVPKSHRKEKERPVTRSREPLLEGLISAWVSETFAYEKLIREVGSLNNKNITLACQLSNLEVKSIHMYSLVLVNYQELHQDLRSLPRALSLLKSLALT